MKQDFSYQNPVRIHFGVNAMQHLAPELQLHGERVMLAYGGGSIKTSGLYDDVCQILRDNDKEIIEFGGIMSNPTVAKTLEGAALAKERNVDFILAVGGGSVIDCAKAIAVFAHSGDGAFERFFFRHEPITTPIIPLGTILTMVGSGSEMNGGSVLTSKQHGYKIGHIFDQRAYPKFSILNPTFTFSVPKHQMVSGIFDALSHLMEQYFSDEGDYVSDHLAEGLMRALIHNARIAVNDPMNYEARSNIMWAASLAASSLVGLGKTEDWEVHMIAHMVGAVSDCPHGMALAAISIPYYNWILPYGLDKFARFATTVWDIDEADKSPEAVAKEGLAALAAFIDELGIETSLANLGVKDGMIKVIAETSFLLEAGYKTLTRPELHDILQAAL